jgi:hypothetical protein
MENPSSDTNTPTQARIRWLREQIAELRKRWPPHSVPPSLVLRLDDLEEELENELRKRNQGPG